MSVPAQPKIPARRRSIKTIAVAPGNRKLHRLEPYPIAQGRSDDTALRLIGQARFGYGATELFACQRDSVQNKPNNSDCFPEQSSVLL